MFLRFPKKWGLEPRMSKKRKDRPEESARDFGVGRLRRHLFICIGPDCIDSDAGADTWKYLKKRMKELDIAGENGPCYRTKCDLPADLHERSRLRRLSRGRVVSRRHARECRADHPGAPHRRADREGSCFARNPLP